MPVPFQGVIWQSYGILAESILIPLYTGGYMIILLHIKRGWIPILMILLIGNLEV